MSNYKLFGDFEEHLLKLWFKEFKTTCYTYSEPILDSMTVDLIKRLCDSLKQDSHVFIMTTDILVQYIMIQNSRNILIENQLLVIVCIILICSKHVGEQSDLRPKIIAKLYTSITEEDITIGVINEMEINILRALHYKLPFHSIVDDLKTFLTMYLKDFKLRVDIVGLCVQILDVVYIYYRRLFFKLKGVYKQSSDALEAFHKMITNRFYLPSGILLCALEMTKLKYFMSVDNILEEVSEICNINKNHLQLLSKYIQNIISSSGHSNSSL
ncbi:hypothetical protein Trydic_g316 [Trypoxylus dichotomus]